MNGMTDADPKEFGKRLKSRRKELGLSQVDLAAAAGYSQSNVGWLESGKAKDIRAQAMDLAGPLRTTLDWLLWEKGPKEVGPHVMDDDELLKSYNSLALNDREAISQIMAKYMKDKKKGQKTA